VHKTWAGKKQTAKPASGRVKVLLHPFFSPLSRPTTRSPKVLDRMRTNLITNELNISCMIVIEPSEDEDLTLIDHTSLSTLSKKKMNTSGISSTTISLSRDFIDDSSA
jgi:hypothetical protein